MATTFSQQVTDLFREVFSDGNLYKATSEFVDSVKENILQKTNEGYSPVKGNNYFTPYTERYKQYKDRVSSFGNRNINLRFRNGVPNITRTTRTQIAGGGASMKWNENGEILTLHNEGMGNMPKRQIIPNDESEIPDVWEDMAIDAIVDMWNASK